MRYKNLEKPLETLTLQILEAQNLIDVALADPSMRLDKESEARVVIEPAELICLCYMSWAIIPLPQ